MRVNGAASPGMSVPGLVIVQRLQWLAEYTMLDLNGFEAGVLLRVPLHRCIGVFMDVGNVAASDLKTAVELFQVLRNPVW